MSLRKYRLSSLGDKIDNQAKEKEKLEEAQKVGKDTKPKKEKK